MTHQELGASVIALCLPALIYVLRDMLDEGAHEDAVAWRWGDPARRPRPPATWARHELIGPLTAFAIAAALQAIL